MHLRDYLAAERLTYREFARRIDVDVAQLHRWASGKRLPPLGVAALIEAQTVGMVTAADFLPLPAPQQPDTGLATDTADRQAA